MKDVQKVWIWICVCNEHIVIGTLKIKAVLKIKLCMNFLLKSFIAEQSCKPRITLYFLNKQINVNIFLSCLSFYVDVIAYIIKCNYLSVTLFWILRNMKMFVEENIITYLHVNMLGYSEGSLVMDDWLQVKINSTPPHSHPQKINTLTIVALFILTLMREGIVMYFLLSGSGIFTGHYTVCLNINNFLRCPKLFQYFEHLII